MPTGLIDLICELVYDLIGLLIPEKTGRIFL